MWTDEGIALDALNAARLVRDFSAGLTAAQFKADITTQSPILHQMTVLGESVKRLSTDFRQAHPSIPWAEIAEMRDRCIRAHDNVNLDVVWNVASRHVPEVIAYLEQIVPKPPPEA